MSHKLPDPDPLWCDICYLLHLLPLPSNCSLSGAQLGLGADCGKLDSQLPAQRGKYRESKLRDCSLLCLKISMRYFFMFFLEISFNIQIG